MSGQKPTTSNHREGSKLHPRRGGRDVGAGFHRTAESDPRSSVHGGASRSGVLGAISEAQQRWPEYNRAIIAISASGTAAVLTAAIVRAVAG